MNKTSIVLIILFVTITHCLFGQMQGSETMVNYQVYKGTFVVNGDMNTYYPVIFKYGDQNRINHLRINRSYGEAGPDALSPTHKGGLTLEIDVNYGGWGGSNYDWRIMDLRQTYHETFAGATHSMYWMGFTVWLRGGGFIYHYDSESPAYIQVAYSTSELIFDYWGNPNQIQTYVYAPSSKTNPDVENISSHKNGFWNKDSGFLCYNTGNVGIGTTNPEAKLTVKGKIVASEIQVKDVGVIPDYVFKPDYELMTLSNLSEFVKQNQHLPEVPSEKEFKENGMNMAEMNALLLKKIEELTLYSIDQNKRIIQLEKQNTKIQALEEKIERIEISSK